MFAEISIKLTIAETLLPPLRVAEMEASVPAKQNYY